MKTAAVDLKQALEHKSEYTHVYSIGTHIHGELNMHMIKVETL